MVEEKDGVECFMEEYEAAEKKVELKASLWW